MGSGKAKIDALNITSSNASDKVKAEMQQMDEELEKHIGTGLRHTLRLSYLMDRSGTSPLMWTGSPVPRSDWKACWISAIDGNSKRRFLWQDGLRRRMRI